MTAPEMLDAFAIAFVVWLFVWVLVMAVKK